PLCHLFKYTSMLTIGITDTEPSTTRSDVLLLQRHSVANSESVVGLKTLKSQINSLLVLISKH
ncbi:MAG TPA: hypothetical protein VGO47_10670, partial [Chlamydiales bacterium]|nr:hypothetical protein [Chlamydiales bacterium]